MQNTNMEIMKNWLYDHCGTLQTPSCVCELAHSEACGIIAFIIALLLFLAYFLFLLQSSGLELLFNLSAKQTELNICPLLPPIFSFMKMKTQRNVNFIFGNI